MNRVKKLKRDLGSEYAYQRFMSDREVSRLRRQAPVQFEDTIAASLTVGRSEEHTSELQSQR